eukprot:193302-Pleurochrysis_carterae.AAC.3
MHTSALVSSFARASGRGLAAVKERDARRAVPAVPTMFGLVLRCLRAGHVRPRINSAVKWRQDEYSRGYAECRGWPSRCHTAVGCLVRWAYMWEHNRSPCQQEASQADITIASSRPRQPWPSLRWTRVATTRVRLRPSSVARCVAPSFWRPRHAKSPKRRAEVCGGVGAQALRHGHRGCERSVRPGATRTRRAVPPPAV